MSDIYSNPTVNPDVAKDIDNDLLPTKKRIMGNGSYLLSFLGGCVSIGTFSMGASLIGQLTIIQSIIAMTIGCIVIGVGMAVNGYIGHKYGVPFTIHLRSSFGAMGLKIPGALRGIPAIVWFGFQSWVGAGAINQCLDTIFGFDNLPIIFIAFTSLQVILAIRGFEGIKIMENVASIFIIGILIYMLYVVNTKFSLEITNKFSDVKGSWGLPFWAATTSFLGIYSTMILNASDYSRNLVKETSVPKTGMLYVFAILPVTLFMGLIGLLVTAATGNSDPIVVFSTTMGSKFLTILTLLFIAFAQLTTNVLNNIVPPAYILMESFNIKWVPSTIIVGLLSIAIMPWRLVTPESAAGLGLFTRFYSAFLGPIFAVMVVDFFILRKKKIDVNSLYEKKGNFKGVNWAGIISIFVGSAFSLFFLDLSWYISLIPTGACYYFLMKNMKSSRPFLVNTIFDNRVKE